MSRFNLLRISLTSLLFGVVVSPLFAQSQTGRITGKITDPSGAAVPQVEIVATDQDTGVSTRGVSSNAGVYAIPFLPPGRYRIEAVHAGFKKYERSNAVLGTSEVLPLDIQLELGNVTETVSVEASAPLLESSTSDVGQFIEAIRRVAAGGTAMDPAVISQLLDRQDQSGPLAQLTPREREVLAEMAEGRSNSAIAGRLYITEKAISKHINNIFTKLDLPPSSDDSRRVLAVLAYLNGQ